MRVTEINFAPCTGFGDAGRSATIYSDDKVIGTGYGETDEEAVTEALIDSGMTFDDAFDAHFAVLKNARVYRD